MSKIINKALNILIITAILFLIGKNSYNKHIEKQKLSQPKYEFVMSLDEAKTHFPKADSISRNENNSYHIYVNGNIIGLAVNKIGRAHV